MRTFTFIYHLHVQVAVLHLHRDFPCMIRGSGVWIVNKDIPFRNLLIRKSLFAEGSLGSRGKRVRLIGETIRNRAVHSVTRNDLLPGIHFVIVTYYFLM